MSLRVPFGLRDGYLYEPHQVTNGKACGCICPSCNHQLIARQNAQTPHFAHAPGEDCKYGAETIIHLAAKQLIAEKMELSFPAVNIQLSGGYGYKPSTQPLYTSNLTSLSEVRIEPWLEGIRPDIVVVESDKQREVLIEIAVTHPVEEPKLAEIKSRGLYAIEIDVSSVRENIDFSLLNKFLFDVPSRGKWLHHPESTGLELDYLQKRVQEWARKQQAESDRFEKYQLLNPQEKIKRNIAKAGITQKQLKSLTEFVAGENAYPEGRLAWQSAVLAYISNKVEEDGIGGIGAWLDMTSLEYWMRKLFEINPPFPDAEKIALWKYLKHLEVLGLLKHHRNKSFEILIEPKNYLE